MSDAPSWLFDYFWCDVCSRVCPKLPWWKDMWTPSINILGVEHQAGKCQWCGTVKIDKINKENK